jgi:hypothetical protein
MKRVALLAGVTAALALPTPAAAVTATSDFTAGDGGWEINGADCASSAALPIFAATGGNPGGYISATDTETPANPPTDSCLWGASAPAAYLGDLRANYGGTISYDVTHPAGAEVGGVVGIRDAQGHGLQTNLSTSPPAADTWTSYSFTLTETSSAGWGYASDSSAKFAPATRAEVFDVLRDTTSILVSGDLSFNSQGEISGIDNVELSEPAQPLDTDGDGVTNAADECPAEAGSEGAGCPVAVQSPYGESACDAAKQRLQKARRRLKKLRRNDASDRRIRRAKEKVERAKAKKRAACAVSRPAMGPPTS